MPRAGSNLHSQTWTDNSGKESKGLGETQCRVEEKQRIGGAADTGGRHQEAEFQGPPTHSLLARSGQTLLTGPGSLSVLSFPRHPLSASCVPGTVLGIRETAGNKTGQNVGEGCGEHPASMMDWTGLAEGKMGGGPCCPRRAPPTYPPCWFTAPASALPEPQGRMPTGVFTASSQSGRSRSPFSTSYSSPSPETVTMPSHSLRLSPWTSSRAWFCRSVWMRLKDSPASEIMGSTWFLHHCQARPRPPKGLTSRSNRGGRGRRSGVMSAERRKGV